MCKRDKDNALKKFRDYVNGENSFLEQLKKEHENDHYTVDDNSVEGAKVCFVFSCPGREELIAGKVCSGQTGKNLDTLLSFLKEDNGEVFHSDIRYHYAILNASNIVHFDALDEQSEAEKHEILSNANLERITNFLGKAKELQFVILFGEKAKMLKKNIQCDGKRLKIIETRHIGYQSLNQIDKDVNDKEINKTNYPKSEERTQARLEVVADEIIKQIQQANAQN